MVTVLVDLFGVLSLADIAVRLERAYAAQLRGGVRARIEEFLQRTGLGLSLTALGIGVKLQLEPRADPLPALHALLDLPLRLEKDGGYRALITSDEFQDLGKVHPSDAILRSHIQHQGEVASVRLRRLGAGADAGAVRHEGAPALRTGGADAARPARRRGHRRIHRRPLPADEPLRGRVRCAARRHGCRPSPARDAPRLPALGRDPGGRHRQAAGLGGGAGQDAARARAGVRGTVAALLGRRAQEPARRGRGTRRAPADERARAARRGQDVGEPCAPAGEVDTVDGRTALVDPLFSLWIDRVASGAFAGGQE